MSIAVDGLSELFYTAGMKTPKSNADGLKLVLTKISRPELGRRLGISKQAIHKWDEVPLRFVVMVEKITNIPREMVAPEHVEFFQPSKVSQ